MNKEEIEQLEQMVNQVASGLRPKSMQKYIG